MDDNEFARYLASYLVQHQEKFLTERGHILEDILAEVIAEFNANLL